jgi:hypothetical protein
MLRFATPGGTILRLANYLTRNRALSSIMRIESTKYRRPFAGREGHACRKLGLPVTIRSLIVTVVVVPL